MERTDKNVIVIRSNGETYNFEIPKYGEVLIKFQDYVPQKGKAVRDIDFSKDFINSRLAE